MEGNTLLVEEQGWKLHWSFSSETKKARREWSEISKCWKKITTSLKCCIQQNYHSKMKEKLSLSQTNKKKTEGICCLFFREKENDTGQKVGSTERKEGRAHKKKWGFPGGASNKETSWPVQATQETRLQPLGREDSLEEEMAAHSSILAWEIPWTEEPGVLQSMRLRKSQTRLSSWTTAKGLRSSRQPCLQCPQNQPSRCKAAPHTSWIPTPPLELSPWNNWSIWVECFIFHSKFPALHVLNQMLRFFFFLFLYHLDFFSSKDLTQRHNLTWSLLWNCLQLVSPPSMVSFQGRK